MSVIETDPVSVRPHPADTPSAAAAPVLLIVIFFLSLQPPIYFFIGTMRLSPDRLLMLILFIRMGSMF